MKKWTVWLMTLALMAAMISGCGSNSQGNGSDSDSPSPTAAANSPDQNQEATAQPAAPTKFSISLRTLNVSYVDNSPNINDDVWVKRLEKLTNTDLDIRLIPHAEFEQKMAQMFAINDIPDVVQASGGMTGKELAGSVQAGVFMPLDDLLQKYGQDLLKAVPQRAWDQQKYEGKTYGIPDYLSNPSRRATVIRMDLLKKTGLPVPKTVDDYLNVLRAFKKLGVEQPFDGRQNLKYADVFFGAYDAYPYLSMFEQQGDQVVPKFFNADNEEKAIQTYKTMFDEGLISKDFATVNPTMYKNAALSGKAGMWNMNANELLQWQAELQKNVPDAQLAIIPSPTGPDGKGGEYLYAPTTRNFLINKNVSQDKAIAIVKFFNWMVSDEAAKFFTYGVEGETYTTDNGKIVYKQPQTKEEIDAERYRTYWLWFIQDQTYTKGLLEQTPDGQQLMNAYDTILAHEGRDGISFNPQLQAFQNNPDIAPLSDQPAPLLAEHIVKMIYGKEPISDWPKVIDEWKSKGGDKVVQEATDRFNNKDGVVMPLER